jgi:hypothetical protein
MPGRPWRLAAEVPSTDIRDPSATTAARPASFGRTLREDGADDPIKIIGFLTLSR